MKFVLEVTVEGAQLWCRQPQGWQRHDGPARGPVWVLTNLPEEGLSDIHVPRLYGRDRQAFVARQLASRFPDSVYRTTLAAAPQKGLMNYLAPPSEVALGLDDGKRLDAALQAVNAPVVGVWCSSMLLGVMGRKRPLPKEVMVVLPCPDGLRIVMMKERVPVLSRLIPGVAQPQAIVAELGRTVRHLENTRVLARIAEPRGVLFLGDASALPALLSAERLVLLQPPPQWSKLEASDWRFALFDQVLSSPVGQLAPLGQRTPYLAAQVQKMAYAGAAALVLLGIALSASHLMAIRTSQAGVHALQAQVEAVQAQVQTQEHALATFGVPAELVRQAGTLAHDELVQIRSFEQDLHQLGRVMTGFESLRLQQLDWHIMPAGQGACEGEGATTGANPEDPSSQAPQGAQTQVEIKFEMALPSDLGERSRLALLTRLSRQLGTLPGATLVRDPARVLTGAPLSGGSVRGDASSPQSWCLSVPARPALAASTGGEP